jgi:hypothetical protein
VKPPQPFLRDRDRIVWFLAMALFFDYLAFAVWSSEDERALLDGIAARSPPAVHRVDLLSASVDEVAILPEVGISRAKEFVRARERGFAPEHVEDLRAIPGFGAATVARIRPYVTLRGQATALRGQSSLGAASSSPSPRGPPGAGR